MSDAPTRSPSKYPTNSPTAVSPGGIAGIVIGCVVFVALVIAGVYYYLNGNKWTVGESNTITLASQSFVDVNPAKLEDTSVPEKVEEGAAPQPTSTAVVEKDPSMVVF